jgi:hypothetical protein
MELLSNSRDVVAAVLGLNLSWDTAYSDGGSSGFSSVFAAKYRDSSRIRPRLFPYKSVPIHHLSVNLPLDAVL